MCIVPAFPLIEINTATQEKHAGISTCYLDLKEYNVIVRSYSSVCWHKETNIPNFVVLLKSIDYETYDTKEICHPEHKGNHIMKRAMTK